MEEGEGLPTGGSWVGPRESGNDPSGPLVPPPPDRWLREAHHQHWAQMEQQRLMAEQSAALARTRAAEDKRRRTATLAMRSLVVALSVCVVAAFGVLAVTIDFSGVMTRDQRSEGPRYSMSDIALPDPVSRPAVPLDDGTSGEPRPTPVENPSTEPLGRPADRSGDPGPFRFISTQRTDGSPVVYDPCRPIRFVVNAKDMPEGGDLILNEALASVGDATGLVFEDVGSTEETPSFDREAFQPDRYGDVWAPVLISWSTPADDPMLAGAVIGVAGSIPVEAVDSDGNVREVLVTGSVSLDGPDLAAVMTIPDGPEQVRAVIVHELGHLVGLAHVGDQSQIMSPEARPGLIELAAGDRAGFREAGRGRCIPSL